MPKNWKLKPEIPASIIEKLSKYGKLTAQLLYNRGLTAADEINDFLDAKYEGLNDPFIFQDMPKAVERVWQAIINSEKICIYGDYDADAVTANAVLQQTFLYLGVDAQSYIPDRFSEGYGINLEALQKIKDKGCSLIITVDCGTNATDAADWCKANSIDLIITDHHEIIGPKSDAYALINPKNPDDKYPYHEITGVGVAFKLATAILKDERAKAKPEKFVEGYEKWLLDLVAIGTVADCHSLMGENRILVKYGLKVLQKTRWAGLRALIQSSGLDFSQRAPDTYALGFVLAPRLNAAGRLEHADIALHLLMETDNAKAVDKAGELESINRRRQDQTERIMSEAREKILQIVDRKVLVIAGEGWNKGIVGLVAGKLAEEFHKPVMVLEKTVTDSTGSARTVGEFDVVEALKHASSHLVRFGGHKQAAGLTLKTENFDLFYQKVLEYAEINLSNLETEKQLTLEAELSPADLTLATCDILQKFEPFGVDNVKPKFLIQNVKLTGSKLVGKQSQHMQMKLSVENKTIDAIYFSAGDFAKNLKIGDTVDVAAEILEDSWNGQKRLKLRVVDLKLKQ